MAMDLKYRSIVFMGKTGSGKGTQARHLCEETGYAVFSTGNKVREVAAQDTPLGREVAKIHVSGWVPEWLASYFMVKALLEEHLEEGLIFESVARKPVEAEKLHEIHEMMDRSYLVIHLDIADDVVIDRMRKRNRDASDTDANIHSRLQAYRNETLRSIEFFESKSKLVTLDANRTEEEVFKDILSLVSA